MNLNYTYFDHEREGVTMLGHSCNGELTSEPTWWTESLYRLPDGRLVLLCEGGPETPYCPPFLAPMTPESACRWAWRREEAEELAKVAPELVEIKA